MSKVSSRGPSASLTCCDDKSGETALNLIQIKDVNLKCTITAQQKVARWIASSAL